MAGPAPVREGFEADRFADWLPTSYWAISDETMETTLTLNTTDFNHDLESRYSVKIDYYEGKNEPVFCHCLTPDELEGANVRIGLADLRATYGLNKIDGMMLVSVRNETVGTPSRPYFITTWGTYTSADGKQVMSFPGQPIIGAEKSYRGFQVWPGAMAATGGVGSLTVHSAYKIVLFGGAINLKTGVCSGPDHFSPFLAPSGGTSQETFKGKRTA